MNPSEADEATTMVDHLHASVAGDHLREGIGGGLVDGVQLSSLVAGQPASRQSHLVGRRTRRTIHVAMVDRYRPPCVKRKLFLNYELTSTLVTPASKSQLG